MRSCMQSTCVCGVHACMLATASGTKLAVAARLEGPPVPVFSPNLPKRSFHFPTFHKVCECKPDEVHLGHGVAITQLLDSACSTRLRGTRAEWVTCEEAALLPGLCARQWGPLWRSLNQKLTAWHGKLLRAVLFAIPVFEAHACVTGLPHPQVAIAAHAAASLPTICRRSRTGFLAQPSTQPATHSPGASLTNPAANPAPANSKQHAASPPGRAEVRFPGPCLRR